MAKLSTIASSCAPFCTEQDIEWIKGNEACGLARRVISTFSSVSSLYILPSSPANRTKTNGLYLGNRMGFPVLYVREGYKSSISDAPECSMGSSGYEYVDSSNRSYALKRARDKAGGQVSKWASRSMPEMYSRKLFELMLNWLKAATASQEIEAGKTIVISSKAQEYLIRLHCGSMEQNVIPSIVAAEIQNAHNELLRTATFTASAHDQAATMFGREKWLLWDMGSYVILAGVNTSSLCQVAQDIMSNKVSISGAYYHMYEKSINLQYTHEPCAYRSFEAIPPEARSSLMSSLAFVKTMLMQDSRVSAPTTDRPGLLGLPFYYDHGTRSSIVSVDGGWAFKCGNHSVSSPQYGQMLLMDKD